MKQTKRKELPLTIKHILLLQIIWYIINFLILFLQNQISFALPFLNYSFFVGFKIIGRSFFTAYLLYLVTTKNIPFSKIGFSRENLLTNISIGVKLSGFLLVGFIICNLSLTAHQKFDPIIKITNQTELVWSLLYFLMLTVGLLIPAFSREVFYRGVIYNYFQKYWSPLLTLLLTAFYYSLSYLNPTPQSMLVYFLIGLITTSLYYKTKTLIAPTIFQAAYQAGLIIYLFSFFQWPF